jgi:hypothetical protein
MSTRNKSTAKHALEHQRIAPGPPDVIIGRSSVLSFLVEVIVDAVFVNVFSSHLALLERLRGNLDPEGVCIFLCV